MTINSASSKRPVSKADIPNPETATSNKRQWLQFGRYLSMKQSAAVFLLGLIIILSSALSYIFYNSVNNLLILEVEKRAQAIAETVAESAQFGLLLSDQSALAQLTASFAGEDDVRYIWIVNKDAEPILPAAWQIEKRAFDAALIKSVLNDGEPAVLQANLGKPMREQDSFSGYHVAVPIWHEMFDHILDAEIDDKFGSNDFISDSKELIGMVQVGLSLERVQDQAQLAMLRSGFLVLGITFITLVISATLLHRWLEPLQVVTRMAKRIREDGYDAAVKSSKALSPGAYDRSAVHGRVDEIGQLYQTFNAMIQELTRHGQRLKEQKQFLKKMVDDQTAELTLAKEDAEAANRSKSVFLASMSHEIRTPLNAVLGYTDMLQMNQNLPDNKKEEYLSNIRTCSQDLLMIINDILDLSQLEADSFKLNARSVNLVDCINSAISSEQQKANDKNIKIVTSVDSILFESDDRIIRQMTINLLSNAIKFSPDNSQIDVNADVDTDTLTIEVCDSGIGMSDDEIQQLQEPFVQGMSLDRTKKAAGAGLGLALVRRFIKLLGGKMYIYSDKGEGTVVRLVMPVKRLAQTD